MEEPKQRKEKEKKMEAEKEKEEKEMEKKKQKRIKKDTEEFRQFDLEFSDEDFKAGFSRNIYSIL